MIRKIFSLIIFVFALSYVFAENIKTIEEKDTEEVVLENAPSSEDEKSLETQENGENVEDSEKDLHKDEVLTKTLKVIEEKNISGTPIKKLENDTFLFLQGFGEAEFKWTLGLEIICKQLFKVPF